MGGVWSYAGWEPSHMRLASREVCDDETWANTVLNRSACSVQERLFELESGAAAERWAEGEDSSGSESDDDVPRRRRSRSIEFAETHAVREFVVEEVVVEEESGKEDAQGELQSSLFIDFDPW